VEAIAKLVGSDSTVLELGAGKGCYVSALRRNGVRAMGFDYQSNKEQLEDSTFAESNALVRHADLSQPQHLLKANWVMSLEVGEHIPKQHEAAFIRNVHTHNHHGIVLSWAISTAGNGHVNPLSNEAVAKRFIPLGYVVDTEATAELRAASGKTGISWFNQTLQVLRRKGSVNCGPETKVLTCT
jgi:cyclopropane fatty-acyl-phospholipid synthase-like methyltransferase